jgi:hypothetical protein
MLLADPQHRTGSRFPWPIILAMALLIAGCKGSSVTGAAGTQVDPMSGTSIKAGGMNCDSNGGAGG